MPVAQQEDDPSTNLPSINRHPVFFTATKPTSKSSEAAALITEAVEAGGGRGGPAAAAAVPAYPGDDDDVSTHKPLSQIKQPPPCIFGGGSTLHVGGDID